MLVCFSFFQSHSHGVATPTNAAEAQILMNAMREDALARIGMDVTLRREVGLFSFLFDSC